MAIFKYKVANKEGKELSGTVEAPDEQIARSELNNLGFSILELKETAEMPKAEAEELTKYEFEAVDKSSKLVSGSIPAENEEEAFKKLTTEYSLTVTALWKEDATDEEIKTAKEQGTKKLQEMLSEEMEAQKEEDVKAQKEEQFIRTKIEYILKDISELLQIFDKELDAGQKAEINKKVDKLLRIKQSKNTQYILTTAEELLKFLQEQEEKFQEKGYQEKRFDYRMKTRKLLNELKKTSKPKSIAEDIIEKIEGWEKSHKGKEKEGEKGAGTNIISNVLTKTKKIFKTPIEIQIIKEQIKVYNKQLWEFAKLYFKEPALEYREKVRNSIRTVWNARKKAKHSLTQAKKIARARKKEKRLEEQFLLSLVEEINSLTGWLIALYLIYYFVSLYLSTKDFGFTSIPKGFLVYDSQLFKYILVILFLLHTTTALKINFFKKSFVANIFLIPIFIFGSIIVLLNF